MGNQKGLKQTAVAKGANALLALTSHASDRDIGRFLGVLERLAPQSKDKQVVRSVRQLWAEDKGFGRLIKRLLREVNPRCRERFVSNFILNNAWGPKASGRQAFAAETGFRPPMAILISPTMRCNLRCEGCYAGDYSQRDDLPYEVIDRVMNEAKELGIYFVTVLGGEPFIRRDLWDLYEKHHDIYFMVYTNGTLLDQAAVDRMAALGNVAPMLSIEGLEAETDARRGEGTYRTLMVTMDRLHAAGVPFGFSSMVTRHNVDTIVGDELNDMLIEKGVFVGWHFLYMPVGRDPDLDLMPTPAQRDLLRREGAARLRATKPVFVVDFWNDAPYVGGCIAGGREYLHINSQGGVEPCIFTHFAVDNVKDKGLADCLRSPFFLAIRRRQPYSDNLLRPCMLIDHPHVFRDIYAECQPVPTHPGAASLVTGLGPRLDVYAQAQAETLDQAWQEDFVARGFRPSVSPDQPRPVAEN
jgi:MoaA/NifB/PqqE/SkfB family radical SAM enzyme